MAQGGEQKGEGENGNHTQALAHPCPLAPHDSLAKPNPCVQMEECLPSYTPGRVDSEADLKHEYLGFAKPYDEVLYELKLKYNVSVQALQCRNFWSCDFI